MARSSGLRKAFDEHHKSEGISRNSEGQLRALLAYVLSVEEEERSRIAHEISDDLGQALAALKIDLVWIADKSSGTAVELRQKIEGMIHLIDRTLQSLRRIAADLRPRVLDDLGLVAGLEWLVRDFQRRTGIVSIFTTKPEDIGVDTAMATAVFRVCQAALTNVASHANATQVEVKLTQESMGLFLEVQDNGRGVPDEALADWKSLGLMTMRERVLPWGGEIRIRRIRSRGSVVAVYIPMGEDKTGVVGGIW